MNICNGKNFHHKKKIMNTLAMLNGTMALLYKPMMYYCFTERQEDSIHYKL